MRSKLILIEGIPGSGKTSIAAHLDRFLAERGWATRLYLEGDVYHPADYESVAYFERQAWETFRSRHPEQRALLERYLVWRGEDGFLAYGQLGQRLDERLNERLNERHDLPAAVWEELAARDVYNVPSPDTYRRLALAYWQAFADQAQRGEETFLFECCFLQNPLTVLVGRHNVDGAEAAVHIQAVADTVTALHPILIYLRQEDPRATLEWVAGERPQAWWDFLISYFVGRGWCQAMGLVGSEGVIAFYEMRQRLELDILARLNMRTLIVDTSPDDWGSSYRMVEKFCLKVTAQAGHISHHKGHEEHQDV